MLNVPKWVLMEAAVAACTLMPTACALAQSSTATQQFVITYGELAPNDGARLAAVPQLDHLVRLASQNGALYFTVNWEIERPEFFSIIQIWRDIAAYSAFTSSSNVQQTFSNLQPSLIAPLDERDGNLIVPQ